MTSAPLVYHPEMEDQIEAMHAIGYAYIPRALNADRVAELKHRMDLLSGIPDSFDRDHDEQTDQFFQKHINNAFNRDRAFFDCLDVDGVIDIAEGVNGNDCHVIGMTAWVTGPGRPDQSLHIDCKLISLPDDITADPRVRIPIFITTAHFYLNDMYEELGPTKFVPGTHVKQDRPAPSEELSILCNAGDAIIFRSEIWHRGTANTSDEKRYLLQVHYAQRMITQKFPPYLNKFQFRPEVLEWASDRQRRLLGGHRPGAYD